MYKTLIAALNKLTGDNAKVILTCTTTIDTGYKQGGYSGTDYTAMSVLRRTDGLQAQLQQQSPYNQIKRRRLMSSQ